MKIKNIFLGGMLFITGCASFQKPLWLSGMDIKRGEPFVIVSRPGGQGRMYPSIWHSHSNRIVLVSGAGNRISDDHGVTWRSPATNDACEAGIIGTEKDVKFLYNETAEYEGSNLICRANFIENGVAVESSVRIYISDVPPLATNGLALNEVELCPAHQFWFMSKAVQLKDGTILQPVFTHFPEDKKLRCVVLSSRDNGRSLQYLSTVATGKDAPWGSEGPNESAMLVLEDGTVLCVMRTGCNVYYEAQPMLIARSVDGGKTWQDHKMMSVRGVNPKLALLPNGVVVCTAGRPGNQVAFSADHGRSWTRDIILGDMKYLTSGYVDVIAVGSNRALVVYEQQNVPPTKVWLWEPPPLQDLVYGIFIDVEKTK